MSRSVGLFVETSLCTQQCGPVCDGVVSLNEVITTQRGPVCDGVVSLNEVITTVLEGLHV